MDAIASYARVGKPTLYRWWPSKGALILDAMMDSLTEPFLILPDTGDIAHDVRTWIHSFDALFADPRLRALCVGVIGTAQHDAELKALLLARVHDPARARNQARIVAAQEAGQLDGNLDPQLFEDILISPLWYRLLISNAPITRSYEDSIVAVVLGEQPVRAMRA